MKFLESLKQNNVNGWYSILVTERHAFWQAPQANADIYQFFNGEQVNIQSVDVGRPDVKLFGKAYIEFVIHLLLTLRP